MTNPFKPTVTMTSARPRTPMSRCNNSGQIPSRIPWRATAVMTARMRLTPRATKLKARATINKGSRKEATALPHHQDDAKGRQQACGQEEDRNVGHVQAGHDRFHHTDRRSDDQHP